MDNLIFSHISIDGHKNAVVSVTGMLYEDIEHTDILTLSNLSPTPRAIRIEGVTFAIQEKMGFQLYWRTLHGYELIMPIESRGFFNFDVMQGLHSPKDTIGLSVSSFGCKDLKSFLILLDLTKQ